MRVGGGARASDRSLGFESRHLENRPKAAARLDLDVSVGWASPSYCGVREVMLCCYQKGLRHGGRNCWLALAVADCYGVRGDAGHGSFGQVFSGRYRASDVAIKVVNLNTVTQELETAAFIREVNESAGRERE